MSKRAYYQQAFLNGHRTNGRSPTLYRKPFQYDNATIQNTPDATLEFSQSLNSPHRWMRKPGVPIFKTHQRIDPATGKQIVVDLPKLYRIVANLQRMERQGVPIRMTLGHTEPTKTEPQQPPFAGVYVNARVAPFGPGQEPAVVCDELLDPQYASVRKNFPYRSSEYYDDDEQITGVALLARDPFLDLGVVSYSKSAPQPLHYQRRADGRIPTFYHYVMGEDRTMRRPQQTNGYHPQQPQYQPQQQMNSWLPRQPATPYAAYPAPPVRETGLPIGTPYGYMPPPGSNVVTDHYQRYPTAYSAPWQGDSPTYNPHQTIPHEHPSTGAIYGEINDRGQYIPDPGSMNAALMRPKPKPPASGPRARGRGPSGGHGTKGHNDATMAMLLGGMGAVGKVMRNRGIRHVSNVSPHEGGGYSRYIQNPQGGYSRYAYPQGYANGFARYEDEEEAFQEGEQVGAMGGEQIGENIGFQEGEEMAMGGEDQALEAVIQSLETAIAQLQEYCGGYPEAGEEGMGPPDTPFPEEEPPVPASRYGTMHPGMMHTQHGVRQPFEGMHGQHGSVHPMHHAAYAEHPRYNPHTPRPNDQLTHAHQRNVHTHTDQHRYQSPEIPMQYGRQPQLNYDRMISQMNYELGRIRSENEILMYERDQADTAACEAEINRLAAMGFMVDGYEVQELKRKPFHERAGYIYYIMERHQKIGTENLPPVLGDPTPGPTPNLDYPLTREEMQKVLEICGPDSDPTRYKQAVEMVRYQRGGQGNGPGQVNRLPIQYQIPSHHLPPQYGMPHQMQQPYGETPYHQYAAPQYREEYATPYGQQPQYADPQQQPYFDPNSYTPPAGSVLNRNPFNDGTGSNGYTSDPQINNNEGW